MTNTDNNDESISTLAVLKKDIHCHMYKNIKTIRLNIRPINLTDAEFILQLVNSEGWLKYIGDRNVSDKGDAKKYIQKILENPHYYYSVFELKDSQQAVGIVTFLNRDDQIFPDIGFALLPEFEKRGYTTEATQAYLDEVIQSNSYEKIIAITVPENQKSIKLLKKLGLKYEKDYKRGEEMLSLFSITATV